MEIFDERAHNNLINQFVSMQVSKDTMNYANNQCQRWNYAIQKAFLCLSETWNRSSVIKARGVVVKCKMSIVN